MPIGTQKKARCSLVYRLPSVSREKPRKDSRRTPADGPTLPGVGVVLLRLRLLLLLLPLLCLLYRSPIHGLAVRVFSIAADGWWRADYVSALFRSQSKKYRGGT